MSDRFSFTDLHDRARALRKRIALPEGEDPRTIQAAAWLAEREIVRPILIGREAAIRSGAADLGVALPHTVPIVDPSTSERRQGYAQALYQKRKHKGLTYEQAGEIAGDVLYFGDLMVDAGDADGCVAGAAHPSPDVVRAAIHEATDRTDRGTA